MPKGCSGSKRGPFPRSSVDVPAMRILDALLIDLDRQITYAYLLLALTSDERSLDQWVWCLLPRTRWEG